MALRKVHKLYLDSRAAKERSHGHADFIWTPDRPLVVDRCRAFIDSVHIPQSFGSIGAHNANTYIAEEQADFTVLAGQNKVYIQETTGGVVTQRVVTMTAATYASEAALASALQASLGGLYTVTGGVNVLTVTHPAISWKIVPRRELQAMSTFASTSLSKHNLQDASDLLGTTVQAALGGTGNVYLGKSLAYRKITLAPGNLTADELAVALQVALSAGSTIGAYTVTFSPQTGKLTVANAGNVTIYSGHYLRSHPLEFSGFSAPWASGDDATGLSFLIPTSNAGGSLVANQIINLLPHHTLFINSDLGSHNDSIGPVSQSSIARKVVCDVPHGSMIHDFHSQPLDFVTLDKQSITAIRVRLTDWEGTQIELEAPWSLSIILVPESEF
jgi:hypothetical protein